MPELPEVEHARSKLETIAVGHTVKEAIVRPDEIVFAGQSATALRSKLAGRLVERSARHGKWGILEFDRPPALLYHFGMTGSWRYQDDEPLVLASSPREVDRSWPPRFTKLELVLSTGQRLALTNARRLGRVLLREHPFEEDPLAKLGFDAYRELPPLPRFRALLERRRSNVKGLLLDQRFVAGVGNWIADEVLYQAGLDPRRSVDSLTADEQKRLHAKLRHVTRTAVAADARKSRLPSGWLFHRRWGKRTGVKTEDGEPIEHLTIGGRTTAWVPTRQA